LPEVAGEFNVQNGANMTWAFALLTYRDEKLFTVVSELNVQDCASMAWAFA
jgi:hypothetical protein